ncbi:MAG: TonB-dependent receptor plug domain-containing protein, partial [Bacteroidota bacterium]
MKATSTLLTLLFTTLLTAQDTLDLAPVVVAANPAWAVSAAGGPVSVLPRARLEAEYYGQEPALLLERLPSVTAYTDAGSAFGYAYFRLRGIDQTRLNFTLDGIPLNEPEDQGFYFNNYVDLLSSMRAVQVQPGVNVTVNGTAAFAGTVQLLSPAATVAENGGEVSAGYGSFGSYRLSAMLQRRLNDTGTWTLYARGSRVGSRGYKDHSDHEGTSAFVQAAHTKGKHLLKITAFGGNQKNQMAWLGLTDSLLRADPTANANSRQERDDFTTTLARVQYVRLADGPWTWSASAYHGFQDGNYDFDLNNFLGFAPTEELYNYAFRYHNLGVLANATYELDGWSLQTGLHGQDYQRQHVGSERTVGQLYENTGRKTEASGFARLSLSPRPLRGRGSPLHLRAAAQLRHVNFAYAGTVALADQTHNFLNYNFEAQLPVGATSFYYRFGSTGREPTRNDLFGGNDDLLPDEDGNALLFVINPERVFDHELGLRGKSADFD